MGTLKGWWGGLAAPRAIGLWSGTPTPAAHGAKGGLCLSGSSVKCGAQLGSPLVDFMVGGTNVCVAGTVVVILNMPIRWHTFPLVALVGSAKGALSRCPSGSTA